MWQLLFNSRECDVLARPRYVWPIAGDGLSASAQCVAQCRAQVMASHSGWLRQSAVRCVADQLLAARQAPACSSGVMLMLGIKRRYSLLDCHQQSYCLWRSQTNYSSLMFRQSITPWCVGAGCFFPMYWSWLFLLVASPERESWLILAKPKS